MILQKTAVRCSHFTKLIENGLENQHRKAVLKDDFLAVISCNKKQYLKICDISQGSVWPLEPD